MIMMMTTKTTAMSNIPQGFEKCRLSEIGKATLQVAGARSRAELKEFVLRKIRDM